MDKKQEDFIKTLQNNVAFQLSLTSKELFHSNFLAWLAEDKDTTDIFNDVLRNCFGAKDLAFDPDEMMVMREYKNFDFCICKRLKNENEDVKETEKTEKEFVPGNVLFVLENKFKSLPYKEQLEKYQKKVEKGNKKGKPVQYCLLSLAQGFKDFGKDWKVATYEEYAHALRNANKSKNKNSFKKKLINIYCKFIKTFSDQIKDSLQDLYDKEVDKLEAKVDSKVEWEILTNHQEFQTIRCNDVWQKIVMQHCARFLAQKVKETFKGKKEVTMAHSDKDIWLKTGTENKGKFFTMVNFFHGEALLELKYLIPEKGLLTLQQQGNHPLRIGILALNKNNGITKTLKKSNLEAWKNKVKVHLKECGLEGLTILSQKGQEEGKSLKSYGPFYYYELKEKITPIEKTLEDMVKEMERLIPIIDSLSQTDK